MKPQPFHPPVREARVWCIPEGAAEELAALLYAQITWGGEPHHSQVSEAGQAAWRSVRERWVVGTQKFLETLEKVGHVEFEDKP